MHYGFLSVLPAGPVPASADTTVLVVDDHRVVREGLRSLLEQEDGLRVVAEGENAAEALRLARTHHPDVVVLDNRMPGGDGLDLLPTLRAELPDARLVLFSLDPAIEARARAAGADAFVAKDAPTDEIVNAVRPSASRPRRAVPAPVLPAFRTTRDLRRTGLVLTGVLAIYTGLFLAIEPLIGASAGVFSTLAVFVAGVLLGPERGIVAAVLTTALTVVLWTATGHRMGDPVIAIGSNGVGAVMLLILGAAAGTLRTLGLRIDRRARRVEAVAEAVRSLSGVSRDELVDVFLSAMLRTVPGDLALVAERKGGSGHVLASSVERAAIDEAAAARLVEQAGGRAIVVNDLAADRRPLPRHRSAIVVPLARGEESAPAVVALFDPRTHRYTLDDIERIRLFADYLTLVMESSAPAAR